MELGIILPNYQKILAVKANSSTDKVNKSKSEREKQAVKPKAKATKVGDNSNGRIVDVSI